LLSPVLSEAKGWAHSLLAIAFLSEAKDRRIDSPVK